jgi:hypothetical protein
MTPPARADSLTAPRLVLGYAVVAAILAACATVSITVGHSEKAAPDVAGIYASDSACLGDRFQLEQSGRFVDLGGAGAGSGKLELKDDRLRGSVTCRDGRRADLDLAVVGKGRATR